MRDYFEKPEHIEARALVRLVKIGRMTLESARELIGIPDRQEQALNAFIRAAGKAGFGVSRAIAFRRKVAHEFETMVRVTKLERQQLVA